VARLQTCLGRSSACYGIRQTVRCAGGGGQQRAHHLDDAAEKNPLCGGAPSPEHPVDRLRMWPQALVNGSHWRKRRVLNAWLMQCRLNAVAVRAR